MPLAKVENMPALNCSDFLEYLGPRTEMEGERRPEADAHLRACPHCQGVVSDLEAIRNAGRELAEVAVEPPAHLWTVLRTRLEEEGLIRRPSWTERWAEWLGRLAPALPRPAVTAACLTILVAAGILISTRPAFQTNDGRWYDGTQATTASLNRALDSAELRALSALNVRNPVVAASLHNNLALVDNYIQLCQKSVRENPQSEAARDYLYGAYQQKAELLSEISERGENTR
jgi:hypothetical protein